jgi:anti-anti-sigma factor
MHRLKEGCEWRRHRLAEENGETIMSRTAVVTGESGGREEFQASVRVSAGVAVVTLAGRLEPSAMPACRKALDSVLRIRAPQIVLDLSQAQLDPASIGLLRSMRGYMAHFGVALSLTGVHHLVLQMLKRDHLDSLLPVLPVDPAQKRAAGRAARREQSPGLEPRRDEFQNAHPWERPARADQVGA